jgi:hypothetical protein
MKINYKHAFLGTTTVIILLVAMELIFGIAFLIKDNRELRLGSHVTDAPYLYYTQEFKSPVLQFSKSDSYRIVVTGGSVARQLGDSAWLEAALAKIIPGVQFEVLNVAVDGYVVEQEFIQLQLLIQYLKPDLVVGINGYNDMRSFGYNFNLIDAPELPPQNYRDFRVIAKGKEESKFSDRIFSLFRNTSRAVSYFGRILGWIDQRKLSEVSDMELEAYAKSYIQKVIDLSDFAHIKGFHYVNFVQPVRYYSSSAEDFLTEPGQESSFTRLYHRFEKAVTDSGTGYSLTRIFRDNREIFIDECHPKHAGLVIMADAIATLLADSVRKNLDQSSRDSLSSELK